jgi:hypothetical protein
VWDFYSPDVVMRRPERFLPASLHGLVGLYARMCIKDATIAWSSFRLHSRSRVRQKETIFSEINALDKSVASAHALFQRITPARFVSRR